MNIVVLLKYILVKLMHVSCINIIKKSFINYFVNTSRCQTFLEYNIATALMHYYIIMHNYSLAGVQSHQQ